MDFKIYTDGGSRGNPGPSAIGVFICDKDGSEILRYCEYIGEGTNNIAEYSALIKGLNILKKKSAENVECFLDSELVVKQLTGIYRVKKQHIRELFSEVVELAKSFQSISYAHLPRTDTNMRIADSLVNKALDEQKYQGEMF